MLTKNRNANGALSINQSPKEKSRANKKADSRAREEKENRKEELDMKSQGERY